MRRLRARLRRLLRHPLVTVPPLVLAVALGWQQYAHAGLDLDRPADGANLLPNGDFTDFSGVLPAGWSNAQNGALAWHAGRTGGYAAGNSLRLTVSDYDNGDLALTGPRVPVSAGTTYVFKGYYRGTAPFALLRRTFAADGSSRLALAQAYHGDNSWSADSDAFQAPKGAAAVQFVYRVYGNGTLELNGLYVQAERGVSADDANPEDDRVGPNVVPNSALATGATDQPADWSAYHAGTGTVAFSYLTDAAGPYVQARLSAAGGAPAQAKWQYPPQPVAPGQYYQFGVTYRSSVPVPVVAEYVLRNGDRSDQTVATAPPADDWTTLTARFTVPAGAVSAFVALPLAQNGSVSARSYGLNLLTRPGAAAWPQALASVTFDGGRQSAYDAAALLKQHGWDATFYVSPAPIETPGHLTADELTALSRTGNEIAAQGYDQDDLTVISADTLDGQLQRARNYLQAAGFSVSDFAPPDGRSDAAVRRSAQHHFTTLRGSESGLNTRQDIDPYNLLVFDAATGTPAALAAALAQAKALHGWLIIDYGPLGTDAAAPGRPAVSAAAFRQELDAIQHSGITVKPVNDAWQQLSRP